MAGPLYAGSAEHAAMWAQVLPSRPHEEKIFRDNAIMQFCWTDKKKITTDGRDEKTSIKSKSALSENDYRMVHDAMVNAPLGSGAASSSAASSTAGFATTHAPLQEVTSPEQSDEQAVKRLRKAQAEAKRKAKEDKQAEEDAKDPEGKVWRESKEKFERALREAKSFAMAAGSALAEVPGVAKNVVAAGYPAALKEWLTKSAIDQRKVVDEFLLNIYTPHKEKLVG
eukprot:9475967-Pyramimonas_sp.AAC.2